MSLDRPVILLAEDDENDVFFMRRALQKAGIDFPFHVVATGREAMDYLGGTGKFSDRAQHPLPSVLFLDLKLPYVPGLDVLEWIRQQPALKALQVFVLTSSDEDRDRERAAQLGVCGYFVKPPTREMVEQVMRLVT